MFRELITWAKTNKPNCLPTRLSAIFYDFIEYRGVFPVIGHHFAPWSPFPVNVRKLPLVTENTLRAKVKILLLFLCVGNSKRLVHLVSTKVRVCSPPRWVCSGSAKFTLAQRELAIPKVSGNTPRYSSVNKMAKVSQTVVRRLKLVLQSALNATSGTSLNLLSSLR